MSQIRFGIMGAGVIAEKFAHAVRLTDNAVSVAVASKTPEKAADFAKRNNIANSCTYKELLERGDIDIVYIATTHNFHYDNIKACLDAGKHVICEKPMVLHEVQARELFDIARERGLFLIEAMWTRFLPSMQRAYSWIKEGKIGKIQNVSGVVGFKGNGDPSSRLMNPALAGGAMYDIGVYAIEIAQFLVDQPILDVMGSVRRDERTGVDTNVSFILRFGQIDACLQCLLSANAKAYMIVNGDEGYIEIPSFVTNNECYLYDSKRNLVEHYKEEFPEGNGFVYEVAHAIECVQNGKLESDVIPARDTIACQVVFDALLG